MIRYKCPKCRATLESPRSMAGQPDRCPMCGQVCLVPARRHPIPLILGGCAAVVVVAVCAFFLLVSRSTEPEKAPSPESDAPPGSPQIVAQKAGVPSSARSPDAPLTRTPSSTHGIETRPVASSRAAPRREELPTKASPATQPEGNVPEMVVLPGHQAAITDLAFTHNGRILVSRAKDWRVRVWTTATGREHSLRIPQGVGAMALAQDAGILAVNGGNPGVTLHDLTSGKDSRKILKSVSCDKLAFTPDGSRLLVSTWSDYGFVWDVRTGKRGARFSHSEHKPMAISPGARYCATGELGSIYLYALPEGKLKIFRLRHGIVLGLRFIAGDKTLAVHGGGEVLWYRLPHSGKAGGLIARIRCGGTESMVMTQDGLTTAGPTRAGEVLLHNLVTEMEVLAAPLAGRRTTALALSADDRYLAAGDADGGGPRLAVGAIQTSRPAVDGETRLALCRPNTQGLRPGQASSCSGVRYLGTQGTDSGKTQRYPPCYPALSQAIALARLQRDVGCASKRGVAPSTVRLRRWGWLGHDDVHY